MRPTSCPALCLDTGPRPPHPRLHTLSFWPCGLSGEVPPVTSRLSGFHAACVHGLCLAFSPFRRWVGPPLVQGLTPLLLANELTWQLFCEGHASASPNEREAGLGVRRPLGPAGWGASLSSGPCACCPALRVVLLPWAPPRRAVGLAVAASRSWDAHDLLWRRASVPELGARSGALMPPLQGAEAGV